MRFGKQPYVEFTEQGKSLSENVRQITRYVQLASSRAEKRADLRRARLFRAILRGADLTEARMTGADLLNADLSGATWSDGQTVCTEGSIGQCN